METKLNFQSDHPERKPDEKFLGNFSTQILRGRSKSGYASIGWKTKRMGVVAYDIYGNVIDSIFPLWPVFIKIDEMSKDKKDKGTTFDMDSKVLAVCTECFQKVEIEWRSTFLDHHPQKFPHIKEGKCPICIIDPICHKCHASNGRTNRQKLPLLCQSCFDLEDTEEEKCEKWMKWRTEKREELEDKEYEEWINKLSNLQKDFPNVYKRIQNTLSKN